MIRPINLSICLIVPFSIVCKRRTEEECDLWNAAPVGRCQYEIRGNLCPRSQSCVRHSTSVDKSSNRAWRQIEILYYDGGQNQMRSKCGAKMKKPRPHVTGRWSQRQRWLRSKDAIDHTTINPSLGLYTTTPEAQRTCQGFCSADLQLLHKESSQIAISFWHVAHHISDKDW